MSDRWASVLALAVFAGALAAVDGHLPPVSLALAGAVVGVAWLLGRAGRAAPAVWCLGAALLAAALAQRSLAGLEAPLATGPVRTEVVLVGDPVPDGRGGVSVDVRLDGRRLRGVAHVAAASALDDRLAGERVTVIGEVRPPGPVERRLLHRHLAGRLAIDTVVGWRPGAGATPLANGLRRTLARGARVLPERQRSLLAGVTLGDDRAQPADMTDAFRAAGLTHLLAVSGQNVAFVLVIATPVVTRLRFGPRLAATLAVLASFALVTRAEPSVLRATAMASVAAVGTARGRPTSTIRTLALGAAATMLVDPLLATSLGFRLSVAGAAGIVVGAGRIEDLLPGPRWLAVPLSVTLAAQAAVSPLLVATFGSVPLASLPANLLAVPAAGPLMVWGLTGGLVAGIAGGAVAQILHLPTGLLLTWLEAVATAAARWPLGDLRAPHLAVLGAGVAAVVIGRALARPDLPGDAHHRSGSGVVDPDRPPRARRGAGRVVTCAGGVVTAVAVVAAAAPLGGVSPGRLELPLGVGATLWCRGGACVVVLDGRARDDAVLAGLRAERVPRVDLVIVRTSARSVGEVVSTMRKRWPDVVVFAPRPGSTPPVGAGVPVVPAALSPPAGTVLDVGGLRLTVAANTGGRLDVEVAPVPAAGSRASPPAPGDRPTVPRSQVPASSGVRLSGFRTIRDAGCRVRRFRRSPLWPPALARGPPLRRLRGSGGDLSSAVVIVPSPPPMPCVELALPLRDGSVDLRSRVLVAGVVPPPRFGREAEVMASAAAVDASGADLVDVSLPPRLIGPVARAAATTVAVRAGTLDQVAAARRAGAQVVMVPPSLIDEATGNRGDDGPALVLVVDDLADLVSARAVAGRAGVPLALDSTRMSAVDAMGNEAAAIAGGVRVIRTTDVRRSRRVAEVMAAILAARRPSATAIADQTASAS
jgi:competence protein ComEC